MSWLRLYSSAVHDPKVQRLSAYRFRLWINLLCLAADSEPRGVLPSIEKIAFALRMRTERVQSGVTALTEGGLIDARDGKLYVHNWGRRQYESDSSTARVKRFRNVAETPPDTDTDTEQSSEPPRQSEIDSSSPPLVAAQTLVSAFYAAPANKKVGALIDLARSQGIPRSGIAAKIIAKFGAGADIVDVLFEAVKRARGDPWPYMLEVLGNGQESQLRNRRLDTDRRAGNGGQSVAQGGSEILTEEEARRILAARATAEGGGGARSPAQSED